MQQIENWRDDDALRRLVQGEYKVERAEDVIERFPKVFSEWGHFFVAKPDGYWHNPGYGAASHTAQC